MKTPSSGPSGFDDSETNRGGADAVEKTTYTSPHGGEPDQGRPADAEAQPALRASGGLGGGIWIVIALAVALAIFFGGGFFR